ncbi:Hypothetical protein, putative [Bodo saltans]|uniref:RING-type domain-containing protein n=1 Tax=Bodo saltans TaxID=75058 RepID=A0A0S4JJY7_BODSA|nr:Hypothetical protein, putative [Bodo saltans]|eukprot:CUG90481.1 Hypothetical protein, putative [Bodo saltans]
MLTATHIPHIPRIAPHDHNASSLAAVWKRDGSVQRVAIAELLDNPALQRWREQPSITIRECIQASCPDPASCRFAHFIATTYVMGPPPVSAETSGHAPTFTTSTQSVPFHHTFHHVLPPPPASGAPLLPSASTLFHQLPLEAFLRHHAAFSQSFRAAGHLPMHFPHGMNSFPQPLPSTDPERTCNLCCEEYSNQKTLYTCDQKHNTCSRCLAQYILTNWRDNRRASSGELRCCHTGCTSRPLTTQEVVRLVTSKAALEVYIDHTNRQTAAQCYAEAHDIVLQESTQAAADVLQQKQLQKSMNAARMCPHCQFGPIDFFGCDDLAQHHGEERNGARTRNSCPQCSYFSAAIQSWQRWDGVVRSVEGSVEQWSGEVDDIDDDDDEDDEYFDDEGSEDYNDDDEEDEYLYYDDEEDDEDYDENW